MYIVAIAWIYVVLLMAATEPTVVAGVMTFIFYCLIPLCIVLYLMAARERKKRLRKNQSAPAHCQSASVQTDTEP